MPYLKSEEEVDKLLSSSEMECFVCKKRFKVSGGFVMRAKSPSYSLLAPLCSEECGKAFVKEFLLGALRHGVNPVEFEFSYVRKANQSN